MQRQRYSWAIYSPVYCAWILVRLDGRRRRFPVSVSTRNVDDVESAEVRTSSLRRRNKGGYALASGSFQSGSQQNGLSFQNWYQEKTAGTQFSPFPLKRPYGVLPSDAGLAMLHSCCTPTCSVTCVSFRALTFCNDAVGGNKWRT